MQTAKCETAEAICKARFAKAIESNGLIVMGAFCNKNGTVFLAEVAYDVRDRSRSELYKVTLNGDRLIIKLVSHVATEYGHVSPLEPFVCRAVGQYALPEWT